MDPMTRKPFQLTSEQYTRLTMPLDSNRVGKNPKGFSHLEAWDVRRWLVRVFGFGSFDVETIALDLVKEIESAPGTITYGNGGTNKKTAWTAVYRAQVRLTIWDQFGGHVVLEDGACGDSTNQPSLGDCHDNAAKTALSQALKRCAVNLGDCFGLGLYNDGKLNAVVTRSLIAPGAAETAAVPTPLPVDEPVLPEPGTDHREEAVQESPVAVEDLAEPVAEPASQRARELFAQIAAATTKEAMTESWRAFRAAAQAGELAPGMADQLKAAWTARKDALARMKRMFALLGEAEITGRDERLRWYADVLGRKVASTNDLTDADIAMVTERTERYIKQREAVPVA